MREGRPSGAALRSVPSIGIVSIRSTSGNVGSVRSVTEDPRPWTIRASRYLSNEPPWWTLREDHVVLPSGADIERYWIYEYPDWCNVVAVTREDDVVLVKQYRHGLRAVHYELPGGVADHGSVEESARTELLEETGYAGGEWRPLVKVCANAGLQTNYTHSFLALGVERVAEPAQEATEDLVVRLVPADRVLSLVDAGEIVQALHVSALLRYLIDR